MRTDRPKKLSIKLSEEELERWHRASLGEPLAVWVRIVVNTQVRATLRALGEEGNGEGYAAASPLSSSPESQLVSAVDEKRAEVDPFSDVPFEDEVNPEIEEPSEEELAPLLPSGALLDTCSLASTHWAIPRGGHCAECGGTAR